MLEDRDETTTSTQYQPQALSSGNVSERVERATSCFSSPSVIRGDLNHLLEMIHEKDSRIKELEKDLNESNKLASEVQFRLLETKRIIEERERSLSSTVPEELKSVVMNLNKRVETEVLEKEVLHKEANHYKSSLKMYKKENKDLKDMIQDLTKKNASLAEELVKIQREHDSRTEQIENKNKVEEESNTSLIKKYERLKMKSREMSTSLEQYKKQSEQTNTELEQTKQKCTELQNQVAFLQGQLSQELKRREDHVEEKKRLLSEINNFKKMADESQKTLNNLKQEQFNTQRLLTHTAEQRKKLDTLENENRKLPEYEEKLKTYRAQIDKLQQQKSELTDQLTEARNYIDTLQSERAQTNAATQKTISTNEEEINYLKTQLKKRQDEIEHFQELTKELEADMSRRKVENNELVSKYFTLKEEHETTTAQINEYHQEVAALKVQLTHFAKIQAQFNALKEENESLRTVNSKYMERFAETESELLEKNEQIRTASKQLMEKKKESKREKLTYNQELREALERNKELQTKLTSAENAIEDFREKLKTFVKQLNDTQKLNKQDKDMLKEQLDKNAQLNEEIKKLNVTVSNLKRNLKQKEEELSIKNNALNH
ncbi:hypothetical protein C9374_004122 [Naegleria lovaniensis]|uniref:Uncharacterized protein n=1 Tax=Naegleria lovaniensis TaxID=51637 RepID=A0AA88KP89_NAELO|nr:uncharacterized protein C9374_004122 [Naegleria lovaniensis]KAG2383451.1 hypothetical protein C9374_004122 [Naegleria lovaniensis]